MSKSVQDYRNIVKILKLQLLKIRQQNNSLSNSLGISSQNQTSSYTSRINNYKLSKQLFAKNLLLFTNFAHKCQLIGITPQMIFRITDKKRDKKISINNLSQIMKRLKLKLDQVQISQLTNLLTKSGQLYYDQYLQYLSAFQINTQKYPQKNQRTYTQICLLKFGQAIKSKEIKFNQLYNIININQKPALNLQDFSTFSNRNNLPLKQIQIVAVFVGLDIQNQCLVSKQVFRREMQKVFTLLQQGIKIDQQQQQPQKQPQKKNKNKQKQKQKDQQLDLQVDTGVQAGNKKQPKKPLKPQNTNQNISLGKGDFGKILNQLKKDNIRIQNLLSKLLLKQQKRQLVKSFSLLDFHKNTGSNGSVSTQQLLKLWLRGRQISDTSQMMFKLLYRHLRQIQFKDPLSRFINLGYKQTDKINQKNMSDVFSSMNLTNQQIRFIISIIGNDMTLDKFSQLLKLQGKKKSKRIFKKMDKRQATPLNQLIKKLLPKGKQSGKFKRLMRVKDNDQQTKQQWDTIFNDQWKCWQYCLSQAQSLDTYWRDHQFGPTQGDLHGYRSIIGNQSDPPPGLPDQQDIKWYTFQQILAKQKNTKDQVIFMGDNLKTTDVIQGKIGNCWFVSSLSIVSVDDTFIKGKDIKSCRKNPQNLIYGVHPILFQYFTNYGLYVFKFYKQFKPVYVVVDDLFPVQQTSMQLIFGRSPNPGLQWVAFLQKAYAKLHHTYSNMISGDISQGLNDLTNALPIKQTLNPQENKQLQKLLRLNTQKQLMGCSITPPKGVGVQKPVELDGQRCGLFYGHAYSISDIINLKTKDQKQFDLLRIRNPWGHGQWCLDWSQKPLDDNPQYNKLKIYKDDLDKYYQKKIKQAQQKRQQKPLPYIQGDDGQFLIPFKDWIKVFSNLFTGMLFKNKQYQCQYIIQKWDKKTPSGICKMKGSTQQQQKQFIKNNHQYILQIKKTTDLLMLLIQQDGRLYRGQKYPYKQLCNAVIFLIFRLQKNQSQLQYFDKQKLVFNNLKLQLRRDVDIWQKMQPGRYAVIPCKMKNNIQQSQFQFRIYSDQDINIKKIRNGNQNFKPFVQKKNMGDLSILGNFIDTLQKLK